MNIVGIAPRDVLPQMRNSAVDEKINAFVFTGKIAFLTFRNGTTIIGLILVTTVRDKQVKYYPTIIAREDKAIEVISKFKRYDRVYVTGSCAVSVARSEDRIIESARFELETIEAYAQNSGDDTNIIAFKAPVSRIRNPTTERGIMSVVSLDLTEGDRKVYPKVLCFANASDFVRSQVEIGDTVGMRCSVYTKEINDSKDKRIVQTISCDEITKIDSKPIDVYKDEHSS